MGILVYGVIPPWIDKGVTMAKAKKKKVSKVVCVRVTDNDMECVRELMRLTRKSASSILRDAFRTMLGQTA